MGCFVSSSPTSILMGGFTKTTENLNQRGSLSTIQTQNSLKEACDYKALHHITKIWLWELATLRSLAGGTCHLCWSFLCVCSDGQKISNSVFGTLTL